MNWNVVKTKRNFREMQNANSQMRNLFEEFFNFEPSGFLQNAWNPAIDLKEDEKGIHLAIEVPGMDEKDLNLSLENNRLTISGEKKELHEDKNSKGYYYSERRYGSFSRTIDLPDGLKTENSKAMYKNGVLKIDFQKSEILESKKIKIEVK